MLYSCTHMATVSVKGLTVTLFCRFLCSAKAYSIYSNVGTYRAETAKHEVHVPTFKSYWAWMWWTDG